MTALGRSVHQTFMLAARGVLLLALFSAAGDRASAADTSTTWISDDPALANYGGDWPVEPFQYVLDPASARSEAEQIQFQQPLGPQLEATQPTQLPSAAQRANTQLFGNLSAPR